MMFGTKGGEVGVEADEMSSGLQLSDRISDKDLHDHPGGGRPIDPLRIRCGVLVQCHLGFPDGKSDLIRQL